jgi:hypothetical protein
MSEKSAIKIAIQKLNRQLLAAIRRATLQQKVELAKTLQIELPSIIKDKIKKYGIKV